MPAPLSKTRYLEGLQCHKLLWYRYHAKDLIPPVDPSTAAIFEQGHRVGHCAKTLFPGGIEIEAKPWEYAKIESLTRANLTKRVPLFEAGFLHEQLFARFDILNPADGDGWDLIEVKSSTEVKDVNLDDVAFQYHLGRNAGLKIRNCYVYVINNQFVRVGHVEPEKLFTRVDVTGEVLAKQEELPGRVAELAGAIGRKTMPEIPIGHYCNEPYECILRAVCWKPVPVDSVFTLYRSRRSFEWYNEGIVELKDLPDDVGFTEAQSIQLAATKSGTTHVDRAGIADFLRGLVYPLYYLDFETFATAIPVYDQLRPYQRVPFQFSLHVQERQGAPLQHHAFLAEGISDPRPDLLSRLRSLLGDSGSIVCYNASFEKGVLKECAEIRTEYAAWYRAVEERVVDLLTPFRSFAYYNPCQRGSASLKVVLPAITGRSYEGMPIADGDTASREYLRVTFGSAEAADRAKVRGDLERYCGFDTEAMELILRELYRMV